MIEKEVIGFRCACGYTKGKPPYSDGFRCQYGNLQYAGYDFSIIDKELYDLMPKVCNEPKKENEGELEKTISSINIPAKKI